MELVVREWIMCLFHEAPRIPGEHLHFVKGSRVTDKVAADEPQAVHVKDAKLIGIGLARAAHLPGPAPRNELVTRHIQWTERDLQSFALDLIQLRVDQDPASLRRVPDLAYPVVLIVSREEVRAETAPGT